MLPHEEALFARGLLQDVTHARSSAVWLSAESRVLPESSVFTVVYRPMGDEECRRLRADGVLPTTQPYQTIVEGPTGRAYAEKYLRGQKKVDSAPTTVVEFMVPCALVRTLFAMQQKPEHGVLSHGLGDKGGHGLPLFNAALRRGEGSFRIVLVKRMGQVAK